MSGRRLPDSVDGHFPSLEPGDYVQIVGGVWYDEKQKQHPGVPIWIVRAPNGQVCSLNEKHGFTLHEDGTLTVTPSIKITTLGRGEGDELWHGYLERGVWRTC